MRGHGGSAPTAVFVLEQTLGHVTHSANLQALVPRADGVDPVFVPVEFETNAWRVPGWSNWTVRAGLRAARSLVGLRRSGVHADVMFVHTQVPAVLLGPWLRRTPTVVSLDATPEQYDSLGEFYAHKQGPAWVERIKHRMNSRCFERAAHLVTWSAWAREGLVDGYGIAPERVTVIAPGVDVDRWQPGDPTPDERPVQILFVGGDLKRKGGDVLIDAFRRLQADPAVPAVELHLVTNAPVSAERGVVIHPGLRPNSPEIVDRYRAADIFCLPTLGDCLPMVLAEAAASGLPLISTDVGAIREIVRADETGILVSPGDADALFAALRRLVTDPALRRRYSEASRRLAVQDHDAQANAARIVDLLRTVAGGPAR